MSVNRVSPARARTIAAALATAFLMATSAAIAQVEPKLDPGVTKAANGYEAPPTKYIVANGTDIYTDHFMYGGKVVGTLKRGESVDALAKVKGYEWLLVGKNGVGIGYVPISLLSPADKYHR